MSQLHTWLRQNPVFAASTDAALAVLTVDAEILELKRHAIFIQEKDAPTHVFALVDGLTRVYHRHPSGREVTVKHLGAPCTLGEMQVLAGLAFIENAQCLSDARLVRLTAAAFRAFLRTDPAASLKLFADVCTRFCIAARNERAVLFEVPARLAALLLSYADEFGAATREGIVIRYPLTQEGLADGLGVADRSVRRVLTTWKKAGWLAVHKGWFVIADKARLDELSGKLRFSINYRLGMNLTELDLDPTTPGS